MSLKHSFRRSPPALTNEMIDALVAFAVWVDDLAVTVAQRDDLAARLQAAWRAGDTPSIANALDTLACWRSVTPDDPNARATCREWMIEQQAMLSERAYVSWTLAVADDPASLVGAGLPSAVQRIRARRAGPHRRVRALEPPLAAAGSTARTHTTSRLSKEDPACPSRPAD